MTTQEHDRTAAMMRTPTSGPNTPGPSTPADPSTPVTFLSHTGPEVPLVPVPGLAATKAGLVLKPTESPLHISQKVDADGNTYFYLHCSDFSALQQSFSSPDRQGQPLMVICAGDKDTTKRAGTEEGPSETQSTSDSSKTQDTSPKKDPPNRPKDDDASPPAYDQDPTTPRTANEDPSTPCTSNEDPSTPCTSNDDPSTPCRGPADQGSDGEEQLPSDAGISEPKTPTKRKRRPDPVLDSPRLEPRYRVAAIEPVFTRSKRKPVQDKSAPSSTVKKETKSNKVVKSKENHKNSLATKIDKNEVGKTPGKTTKTPLEPEETPKSRSSRRDKSVSETPHRKALKEDSSPSDDSGKLKSTKQNKNTTKSETPQGKSSKMDSDDSQIVKSSKRNEDVAKSETPKSKKRNAASPDVKSITKHQSPIRKSERSNKKSDEPSKNESAQHKDVGEDGLEQTKKKKQMAKVSFNEVDASPQRKSKRRSRLIEEEDKSDQVKKMKQTVVEGILGGLDTEDAAPNSTLKKKRKAKSKSIQKSEESESKEKSESEKSKKKSESEKSKEKSESEKSNKKSESEKSKEKSTRKTDEDDEDLPWIKFEDDGTTSILFNADGTKEQITIIDEESCIVNKVPGSESRSASQNQIDVGEKPSPEKTSPSKTVSNVENALKTVNDSAAEKSAAEDHKTSDAEVDIESQVLQSPLQEKAPQESTPTDQEMDQEMSSTGKAIDSQTINITEGMTASEENGPSPKASDKEPSASTTPSAESAPSVVQSTALEGETMEVASQGISSMKSDAAQIKKEIKEGEDNKPDAKTTKRKPRAKTAEKKPRAKKRKAVDTTEPDGADPVVVKQERLDAASGTEETSAGAGDAVPLDVENIENVQEETPRKKRKYEKKPRKPRVPKEAPDVDAPKIRPHGRRRTYTSYCPQGAESAELVEGEAGEPAAEAEFDWTLGGTFLNQDKLFRLLLTTKVAMYEGIPDGIKENIYFTFDNSENVRRRREGAKSVFYDDCGIWAYKMSSTKKTEFILENDKFVFVLKKNGLYTRKHRTDWYPLAVQPSPEDIIIQRRYYSTLKRDPSFRKRITWFETYPGASDDLLNLGVAEYLGKYPTEVCIHGNSKCSRAEYKRTEKSVLMKIAARVAGRKPADVYQELLQQGTVPRDLKQIYNIKYNVQQEADVDDEEAFEKLMRKHQRRAARLAMAGLEPGELELAPGVLEAATEQQQDDVSRAMAALQPQEAAEVLQQIQETAHELQQQQQAAGQFGAGTAQYVEGQYEGGYVDAEGRPLQVLQPGTGGPEQTVYVIQEDHDQEAGPDQPVYVIREADAAQPGSGQVIPGTGQVVYMQQDADSEPHAVYMDEQQVALLEQQIVVKAEDGTDTPAVYVANDDAVYAQDAEYEAQVKLEMVDQEGTEQAAIEQGAIIGEHGAIVSEHGTIIGDHSTIVSEQGTIIGEHGAIVSEQGAIIEDHNTVVSEHGTIIMANDNGIASDHGTIITSMSMDDHGTIISSDIVSQEGAVISEEADPQDVQHVLRIIEDAQIVEEAIQLGSGQEVTQLDADQVAQLGAGQEVEVLTMDGDQVECIADQQEILTDVVHGQEEVTLELTTEAL